MSTIYTTIQDFEKWENIGHTGKLSKLYGSGNITKYNIGYCDSSSSGYNSVPIWIRDSVYDKLKSGEYKIDKIKSVNGDLFIIDSDGNEVTPIHKGFCY